MPLFSYRALDTKGKKRKGLIEASTEQEAKSKLRSQGIMVMDISRKIQVASRQNLRGDNLVAFTVQLAQLVNAGVPLYESMIALEEQYRGESFHQIILSLCDQIKSGTPLSSAMANYPNSFNRMYCAMITAGESAGALDIILEKLSELLEKQDKLKKQITTAMIYPAILASFALIVIIMLMGFVVPSIEGIFAERQLNNFTSFVLGASYYFRHYWWVYVPLIGILGFFSFYKLRSPEGKLWLERLFLRLPVIKHLVVQAAVARFSRTMATLQRGGLTIIDSLRISREVMRNATLEKEIEEAEEKIVGGSSLSAELARSKRIPHMVSRMLAVGEESGSTVAMLNRIADMYEGELEKTLERLMALAQPIILIVMGMIIGTVLLAILLPLTDVSSFSI